MKKQIMVFDSELIGSKKPVYLFRCRNLTTKIATSFWEHKRGHMSTLRTLLLNPRYTWVGFNSENFDRPIAAAAVMGYDAASLKTIANEIIQNEMRSWKTYKHFNLDFLNYDHIDLIEVAPGVMVSLKTYMARLGFPTMQDMPFNHDQDLTPKQLPILEAYCDNDIKGTTELYRTLKTELDLRHDMGLEYELDLRSKSDAQVAEAIFKSKLGLRSSDNSVPSWVSYSTPDFIKTDSETINWHIDALNTHQFTINRNNGSPEVPDFLQAPVEVGKGTYQMGVGGLHSTHDTQLYLEETEDRKLSDFDVASYYPKIMIECGLIPRLGGNKGERFLDEYTKLFYTRLEAKRAGNKKVANSLKIALNGTFGKLGSIFCSFYSPALLLAVTITGQLNLLCLIHELEKIRGVKVESANTDGILVSYPPSTRERVLKVFATNSKRTKFEYEETPYSKVAMKDVNNYFALTKKGECKRKGLYASNDPKRNPLFLQKNPTMDVCSNMVEDYLRDGVLPEKSIRKYKNIKDFVAVRNVKGGGIQHEKMIDVDDWEPCEGGWTHSGRTQLPIKRKSRPPPRSVGVGGVPFGRVARWYMTIQQLPPLSYISSGNTVPKTEGAKVCMNLPKTLPPDLDKAWYINEAYAIMEAVGIKIIS